MKLKKKSGLIGVVVALSAASLISVGFASWVISQGDEKTVDGTITVDDVTDNRHVITLGNPSGAVRYGHKADANVTNPWLTNDEAGQENLTITVSISVTHVESTFAFGDLDVELVAGTGSGNTFAAEAANTGYSKAYSDGVVAALPTTSSGITCSGSVSDGTYSGTITIVFGWGSEFNGQNPYTFYNTGHQAGDEKTTGVTYADHAVEKLTLLKTDLTNVTYRLTVGVDA